MKDPNENMQDGFLIAATDGRIDDVKRYLEDTNLDINAYACNTETTALHQACAKAYYDIVELLLDNGANTEVTDKYNITPLMLASKYRKYSITKLLLTRGAKVNGHAANGGNTSLHIACVGGCIKCVEELLAHGADTTIKNSMGYTPLDVATKKNRTKRIFFSNPVTCSEKVIKTTRFFSSFHSHCPTS